MVKARRSLKMESREILLGLFTFCNFPVLNKQRPLFFQSLPAAVFSNPESLGVVCSAYRCVSLVSQD